MAERNQKGAEGRLILAVRTTSADEVSEVSRLMQEAGATDVEPITRGTTAMTAGVSAASWTG